MTLKKMKKNKTLVVILEIAKYAIGLLLGYLEGSEHIIESVL